MKTITENETKLSKYLVEDNITVILETNRVVVGHPEVKFYVNDLNKETATLTENVTDAPADWQGNRYTYDPSTDPKWVANPDWVE